MTSSMTHYDSSRDRREQIGNRKINPISNYYRVRHLFLLFQGHLRSFRGLKLDLKKNLKFFRFFQLRSNGMSLPGSDPSGNEPEETEDLSDEEFEKILNTDQRGWENKIENIDFAIGSVKGTLVRIMTPLFMSHIIMTS